MQRIVQTIGNNQLGGDNGGFSIKLNIPIFPREKKAAKPPTASGTAIEKDKILQLLFKLSPR